MIFNILWVTHFSSIRDKFSETVDIIDRYDDGDGGTGRSLTSSDEGWVVPMLVISAISVAVICIYQVGVITSFYSPSINNFTILQVLIIIRAYRSSPSRRHLFLSQVLLLGLSQNINFASFYGGTQT